MDSKREALLKNVCKAINSNKTWGGEKHDAVTYIGSQERIKVDRWSSGCASLDDALGGGWVRGRLIEIYGPESGGKTTLCYHAISEFQKAYPDDIVAFIDTEYTFDPEYASSIGVNVDELMLHQPATGEQALNIARLMVEEGVGLIIVDSIAGLTPQRELEGEIGDAHVGLQARMMSQSCRILTSSVSRKNSTIIFTNQIRDKIGVMWGEKSTTSGGRALRFYASLRVEVVRIGSEKDGDEIISNKVKATVKKSKVSSPYKVANFIVKFGSGIDAITGLFDTGVDRKIIKKKGNTYYIGEEKLSVGRSKSIDALRDSESLQSIVSSEIQTAREETEPEVDEKEDEMKNVIEDEIMDEDEEVSVTDV